MYYCPKCNYSTDVFANFCPVCGAKMEVSTGAVVPEVSDAPHAYSKPKLIIGGIFGIAGFILALGAVFLAAVPVFLDSEVYVTLRYLAYIYSFSALEFALPLTIIGFLFSNGVIKKGASSGLANAGRILGLFGIVLACGAIAISVINFKDISNVITYFSSSESLSMYDF